MHRTASDRRGRCLRLRTDRWSQQGVRTPEPLL